MAQRAEQAVELRVRPAHPRAQLLGQQREDAVELRRHEAGAAVAERPLAVVVQRVAGFRVGVHRHVGRVAARIARGQAHDLGAGRARDGAALLGGRGEAEHRLARRAGDDAGQALLVRRHRVDHADTAAAADRIVVGVVRRQAAVDGDVGAQVVPRPRTFRRVDDGALGQLERHGQRGAAGGDHVGAAGRVVHREDRVVVRVGEDVGGIDVVGRLVAGRRRDGRALRGGLDEQRVVRRQVDRGVVEHLALAPADGQRVAQVLGDRLRVERQRAGIGVGGHVDADLRARRDAAGLLDVQRRLVRAVGRLAGADVDGRDARRAALGTGQAGPLPVGGDVRGVERGEGHDAQRDAGARDALVVQRRDVVLLGQVHHRVGAGGARHRRGRRIGRGDLLGRQLQRGGFRRHRAQVRVVDRLGAQARDVRDDVLQHGRDRDAADGLLERAALGREGVDGRVERRGQARVGAVRRQHQLVAVDLGDGDALRREVGGHAVDDGLRLAEARGEFLGLQELVEVRALGVGRRGDEGFRRRAIGQREGDHDVLGVGVGSDAEVGGSGGRRHRRLREQAGQAQRGAERREGGKSLGQGQTPGNRSVALLGGAGIEHGLHCFRPRNVSSFARQALDRRGFDRCEDSVASGTAPLTQRHDRVEQELE